MTELCRWGILGTANIARKNWKAMQVAENATITAVASRDPAKSAKFIAECQAEVPFATAPTACGSYEELLKRSDVDAVYIPLPTGIRKEWVIRAAQAGKHILCEKPCGTNAADVVEMLEACKKHRVQFMDGVMFMHSARLPLLREVIGSSVGEVRRITSQFTFAGPEEFRTGNIRVNPSLEPLGCLGDLGWYNLRFALWTMQTKPERVSARIIAEQSGVPMELSGELYFQGNVTSSFYCSFHTELQQWAHISGTKGSITVPDFVLSYYGAEAAFESNTPNFHVKGCTYNMESHPVRHSVREYSQGMPGAQEVNMITNFSSIALSGKLDPTWGDWALHTQQTMDACMTSARKNGTLVDVPN